MEITSPTPQTRREVEIAKASSWEAIRRVADKYLPRFIRTVLDAFDRARSGTSVRALIRLLEEDARIEDVVNEIDWIPIDGPRAESTRYSFPILLREVLEATAQEGADALQRNPQVRVRGLFDVTNPRVSDWIREHSGARITAISEESRRAIRELIATGYERGMTAAQLGRAIRSSIGLTPRQARAVANMRARMMADGIPAERIDKVTGRYAERLLRQRAEVIARTEIIAAENAGQIELWQQQIDAGIIEATALKEWIVTPDDRLCPECQDMDGQQVPVSASFVGADDAPPLHPNCRCAIRLVFPKDLEVAA